MKKKTTTMKSLWRAAYDGDVEAVNNAPRAAIKHINSPDPTRGLMPLHFACLRGHEECVTALLAKGADPNGRDTTPLHWTPLHYAAREAQLGVIKLLCEHGAQPGERDSKQRSSLDVLQLTLWGVDNQMTKEKRPSALFSMGKGTNLELGHGTNDTKTTPTRVKTLDDPSLGGVVAVAGSRFHSVAVMENGSVWSWGLATGGRLGHGTEMPQSLPKEIKVLSDKGICAVHATETLTVFLSDKGVVWWCGNGVLSPQKARISVRVVQVAVGSGHFVALSEDGKVFTWGEGSHGQLGFGNKVEFREEPTMVTLPPADVADAVAAGNNHTLILMESGKLMMCGAGRPYPTTVRLIEREVGCSANVDEEEDPDDEWEEVKGSSSKTMVAAKAIAAGGARCAAVSSTGRVHMWNASSTSNTRQLSIAPFIAKAVSVAEGHLGVLTSSDDLLVHEGKGGWWSLTSPTTPTPLLTLVESFVVTPTSVLATTKGSLILKYSQEGPETLITDCSKLAESVIRGTANFTDVQLRSGDGGMIAAHRLFITQSKLLAEKLKDPQVSVIDIPGAASKPILSALVRLLYTGAKPQPGTDEHHEVTKLANALGLTKSARGIQDHLHSILESGEFSDVTVKVEETRFKAHRVVLASRCDFFDAMLSGGMRESLADEVVVEDISASVFHSFLQFMYTDLLGSPLPIDKQLELLFHVDRFLMPPRMTNVCLKSVAPMLDFYDNIAAVLEVAEQYGHESLRRMCVEFFLLNITHLISHRRTVKLNDSLLSELQALCYFKVESHRAMMAKFTGQVPGEPDDKAIAASNLLEEELQKEFAKKAQREEKEKQEEEEAKQEEINPPAASPTKTTTPKKVKKVKPTTPSPTPPKKATPKKPEEKEEIKNVIVAGDEEGGELVMVTKPNDAKGKKVSKEKVVWPSPPPKPWSSRTTSPSKQASTSTPTAGQPLSLADILAEEEGKKEKKSKKQAKPATTTSPAPAVTTAAAAAAPSPAAFTLNLTEVLQLAHKHITGEIDQPPKAPWGASTTTTTSPTKTATKSNAIPLEQIQKSELASSPLQQISVPIPPPPRRRWEASSSNKLTSQTKSTKVPKPTDFEAIITQQTRENEVPEHLKYWW